MVRESADNVWSTEASLLQQGEVPITTETTLPDTEREAHSSHRADTDLCGREYWLHKQNYHGMVTIPLNVGNGSMDLFVYPIHYTLA